MSFSIIKLAVSAVVLTAVLAVSVDDASAFKRRHRSHRRSHHATHFNYSSHYYTPYVYRPTFHYDYYYHHEYYHWTPWRGLHSHGHYDAVPHYGSHFGHH